MEIKYIKEIIEMRGTKRKYNNSIVEKNESFF